MRSTTVQRSALELFAVPTPMIAVEMLCVVETGMPTCAFKVEITASSVPIRAKPSVKPMIGELTIGMTIFQSSPLPCHHGFAGCDQISTCQLPNARASAAPHRPPISAWLDDEGR